MLTSRVLAAVSVAAIAALAPVSIAAACGDGPGHGSGADSLTGQFRDFYRTGPVLGSGCGANGELGDTIPDGTWLGYLRAVRDIRGADFVLDFDVVCVYHGAYAEQIRSSGQRVVLHDDNFAVVNNNPRTRPLRGAALTEPHTGLCDGTGGFRLEFPRDNLSGRIAWVDVHDGIVTTLVFGCA
jgi:hypothetical protein